jgi:hypothetical protein
MNQNNSNYRNNGNGKNKPWQDNKNKFEEKKLALRTAKVIAYQKIFEEQIKSIDRYEAMLKKIIPENFVELVSTGHTTILPKAKLIMAALNNYFGAVGLAVDNGNYDAIVKFLGTYQMWRDEQVSHYKKELEENIVYATEMATI